MIARLVLLSACVVMVMSYELPSWRNMEKLRRSNCTKCKESLRMNIQEILPRLTMIKQRILNAIGRNPEYDQEFSNEINSVKKLVPDVAERPVTATPQALTADYRLNEIVSYSKPSYSHGDEGVLEFTYQNNRGVSTTREEAVGASLLLYVDRRRKIRKGGKGKKIVLEVSTFDNSTGAWASLAVLRTRVKKRRWKRISLPVKAAQHFLDSEQKLLDLKITCKGCGRLVNIVLNKQSIQNLNQSHLDKKQTRKYRRRIKRREKLLKRKQKHSGTPILVISTRVEL